MAMKSEPGAELACKAHNKVFEKIERGIISHYAAKTMAQATTIVSWVSMINEMSGKDFSRGLITDLEKPSLQIIGDLSAKLPGEPSK
ncbi:hypothetical protein L0337_01720 [candidate division KSB1 bacterium]|nr:hypothetical protein [candidate division KSB1 bacterium]